MTKKITKHVVGLALLAGLLLTVSSAFAQQLVSGKVSSEDGEALPGVSIAVKGSSNGTTTDADGNFSIQAKADDVLVFSYIGYEAQEVKVGAQTQFTITMKTDLASLDELVVIGYGTQKKTEVTSAVASVKEKDFTAGAMRDASELIKGKVAGLIITNGSGDPSASPNISLRGIATLTGSSTPLILINGIPGDFNTVSPSDIVSVDVLKDASAAAIYGTRGANGVILITTRNGHKNTAPTVSYAHYSAFSNQARKADFMTASEYQKAAENFTFNNNFVAEANAYGGVGDTDWLEEITQRAYMQSHNLSLQGGGASSNYAASVNYVGQNGVFKGTFNKELRVSLDFNQYLFNDKVKFGINLLRGQQNLGALGDGGSFNPLIYRNAVVRNPLLKVKDAQGDWIENASRLQYYNPVAMIEETDGTIDNNWTRVTSNITVDLLEGWQTNLMLASDVRNSFRGYAETKEHWSTTRDGKNGYASRSDGQTKTNYLELTSKYSKTIRSHNFTILGGYSYQYNVNEGGFSNNLDFPTDAYSYHNLGAGNGLDDGRANMGSYKNDNTLIGFFGRVNYGFDNRFNVLASVRQEGSSKFGDNYKWGTFPAASASWILSNEGFLQGVSKISMLKLRVGYGTTGVIPGESYRSKTKLDYDGSAFYNNGEWVDPLQNSWNPNPDLRWEKSKEVNIGLDFGFFNSRVTGSIDGYVKKTEDMLWEFSVPTPPNLAGRTLANVGEMENKGIEIFIGTVPVKTENFEWSSNITFSHNANKLVSLSNDLYQIEGDYINEWGIGDPISMVSHRIETGKPLGNFWGLKSVDITTNEADPAFNGFWIIELPDGTRQRMDNNVMANDANSQVLGNGIPKFRAGWINTVRYKNFDLSIVMTGAFGYQIMNQQRMFYENPNINYNVLNSSMDKVYGKRTLGYRPQAFVSYYIEDGDYVKVENATLGYNVKVSSLKFIRGIRLYVSGSNLGTITGYKGIDPEISRNNIRQQGIDDRDKYPTLRTYTVGLNVNF